MSQTMRSIRRAVATTCLGALVGAAGLIVLDARSPDLTFDLHREQPPGAAGFYPAERNGQQAFVWTSRRADFTVPGVDRNAAWSCAVRFRGARPDPAMAQPDLDVAFDGVTVAVRRATNDFQQIDVLAPARPGDGGLTISLVSSTTFSPGASDRRQLGVQVDLLTCRPEGARVMPPRSALWRAAAGGAAFGAAIGLIGFTLGLALAATALVAVGQDVPLSIGLAQYGAYPSTLAWMALWIAGLMVASQKVTEIWTRQPLRQTARFVLVCSAVALYFQLIGLCHPSKTLVDAVFHAHRLEWVLTGRYYFTQPLGNGVQFPYAIGLYVFAAPWSVLAHDHVALLRIVVCASSVVSGALVYLMIVRTWGDRLTGAVAVGLVNLVPLSFIVVGNANLTNAFGASVALATVAAVTIWPLKRRDVRQLLALIALAALAFLSHVGTFTLLAATLLVVVGLYLSLGGPRLRVPAWMVLLATVVAAMLAVVLYYGHGSFIDVYRAAGRVHAGTGGVGAPLRVRAVDALDQIVTSFGWPMLILAVAGAWRLWADGLRDRLVFALAAWGLVCLGLLVQGLAMPVAAEFQRYAAEFLGRVDHATAPAVAILAARGAVWGWRAGIGGRIVSGALVLASLVAGASAWLGWMR